MILGLSQKKVWSSLLNFPSSDYIYSEPYGNVLILSPWNYPFQLALCPLVAAVAAGNKVTLKPSELTPHTAAIISKIITETFPVKDVAVVTGDATVAAELLKKTLGLHLFHRKCNCWKNSRKSCCGKPNACYAGIGRKKSMYC